MTSFSDLQLDRTSIHLNALDLDSKDGNFFKFSFPRSFTARKMRLRHVEIPGSALLVHAGNNAFSVSYDGNDYKNLTIPIGTKREDLEAKFRSQLQTGIDANFTVTNTLDKLTIGAAAAFSIRFSSAWALFGFAKDTVYSSTGNSVTAPACTRFDGTSLIDVLTSSFNIDSYSSKKANCLARIHTVGPTTACFYTAESEQYLDLEGAHLVRGIQIELIDEFGQPHDLRGSVPTISLDFIRSKRPN